MPTIELYDNNHTGFNADITFSANTGGTYSLGNQVIPYTFYSNYPYGIYTLFYPQWEQTCTLEITGTVITDFYFTVDTSINLDFSFLISGDGNLNFDMSIDWGDGSPIDSSYIGYYNYIAYHHYSTIGTYNVIITLTDYTVITVIASGSIYNLGYDNVLSVNNFQLFTNPNFNTLAFQGNRLSTDNVNNLLIAVSGITTYTYGYFDTQNQIPPACPTGDGILALNHLVNDLSWTVYVDTGCP
jgi:hypothetical protein